MDNPKYKVGDRIEYLTIGGGFLNSGKIILVGHDDYVVKKFLDVDNVPHGQVIKKLKFWWVPRTIFGLIVILFIGGFATIERTPLVVSDYSECLRRVGHVMDNINDTVGASYALGDTPTGNLEALLDHCMDNI